MLASAIPNLAEWAAAWLVAYLVGSIPFGVVIARSRGVDIRQHGSGNIGATNVGRVLGQRLGLLCFLLDLLKGLIPSVLAGWLMGIFAAGSHPPLQTLAWLAVPVAAIAGHMFPVWLRFRGGKGVATGLGALVGIFPVLTAAALAVFGIWVLCARITRYVGISSCVAALLMPFFAGVSSVVSQYVSHARAAAANARASHSFSITGAASNAWPYIVVTALLAALVIYKHRGNIRRTIEGTEMKIGERVQV
ncbi:MAG: glycerol-3-phosphate 1-O-acyltransferase PlsY [Phycisphaerales bacterium]